MKKEKQKIQNMDHVAYLDYRAKELEHIKSGRKTMIIRGAMGRKLPYGRVHESDVLYFIENKGDGLVKGKAVVDAVFNSDKLSREASLEILEQHQDKLLLSAEQKKKFSGKRYLVILSLRDFEETEAFKIDRSEYGNMDDWLPVEKIEKVKANE